MHPKHIWSTIMQKKISISWERKYFLLFRDRVLFLPDCVWNSYVTKGDPELLNLLPWLPKWWDFKHKSSCLIVQKKKKSDKSNTYWWLKLSLSRRFSFSKKVSKPMGTVIRSVQIWSLRVQREKWRWNRLGIQQWCKRHPALPQHKPERHQDLTSI